MTLEVFTCEQGSDDWYAARLGIPTASEFSTVMAKGEGKTRRTYMLKLAGEVITGLPMDSYSNGHMERGKGQEAEARDLYALHHDADLEQVGFVRNGPKGASPDSLIGLAGALEVKTKLAHLQIDCLLKDAFPSEHVAQCQGVLWVTEREWIDIAVYSPKLPLFVKRAHRDEAYIRRLSDEVDAFNYELAQLVEKIQRYGAPAAVAA